MQLREDFSDDVAHELMLGGDPLRNALIDLSQRGRHNVELALARLRLFALGFHTSPTIKRILGRPRRDPELSIEAIPALGHCHLAQLITRRGGSGLGNSLTSSARSRATRNAPPRAVGRAASSALSSENLRSKTSKISLRIFAFSVSMLSRVWFRPRLIIS